MMRLVGVKISVATFDLGWPTCQFWQTLEKLEGHHQKAIHAHESKMMRSKGIKQYGYLIFAGNEKQARKRKNDHISIHYLQNSHASKDNFAISLHREPEALRLFLTPSALRIFPHCRRSGAR
jgi:hypothetical protein